MYVISGLHRHDYNSILRKKTIAYYKLLQHLHMLGTYCEYKITKILSNILHFFLIRSFVFNRFILLLVSHKKHYMYL